MVNQKRKKQVPVLKKKQFNKNSVNRCSKIYGDNFNYFIPFIIIITAAVFANSLGNNFIENWDDQSYILNNEIIKQLNWKNIKEIFSSFYFGSYQPVSMLTYIIEYKFFGLNPFPYHLTNYILHILNAILVYIFLKRFTGKPWVAIITSLFFAVHPMHVESVAWISERKDVLYTLFFILSLISYTKYLKAEEKKYSLIWSFIWFFLSLLSKPAAVCLPLVLILMDYYHNKKLSWKKLISKIPFFVLAIFFGVLAVISQKSSGAISDLTPLYNITERVFLVSYSTVYYIFKVFVPFNLSALHFYPVKSGNVLPFEYYLALPVIFLFIWGVYKSGNFKHELIFGFLFYLATIFMVLQIIPAGQAIVSERYSYIPYIGIFFIFGQFFSYIKDSIFSFGDKIKSIIFILLIALTVLYSYLTYERNKVWKNGMVLFTDVINKYPHHGYGWFNRGSSKDKLGDFNGALSDYNTSIKLNPDYPDAFYNRGTVYNKINKFDSAIADFNVAIKLKPDFTDAFINRGISFMNLNRINESLSDFNKAIELNPELYEVYFNRGSVYDKAGKYENAISDYTKGLEIFSDYRAYFCRGLSKAQLKDFAGAVTDYNKAIELNPKFADAYLNRGFAKFNQNNKTEACSDWISAQKYGHSQAAEILEKYCK